MTQTVKAVCGDCRGTGLYVGTAERDGAAVVCAVCKGAGCKEIKYEPFVRRGELTCVERVYRVNPGIMIGKGNGLSLRDFGGIPFDEWQPGKEFPPGTEDRQHTCPAWWYQSADYSRKPNWSTCAILGSFSRCSRFSTKSQCWLRFDAESPTPKGGA